MTSKQKTNQSQCTCGQGISDELFLGDSQVPQTHVDHVQGNAQDHGWHCASNCLNTSFLKMLGLKEKTILFLWDVPILKNYQKLVRSFVLSNHTENQNWRLERFKP